MKTTLSTFAVACAGAMFLAVWACSASHEPPELLAMSRCLADPIATVLNGGTTQTATCDIGSKSKIAFLPERLSTAKELREAGVNDTDAQAFGLSESVADDDRFCRLRSDGVDCVEIKARVSDPRIYVGRVFRLTVAANSKHAPELADVRVID